MSLVAPLLRTAAFRKPFSTISSSFRKMSTIPAPQQVTLPSNGQTINYVKSGDGPNVAFLMTGALGVIGDMKPQLEGLNSSGKLTLVAWDPPGYGKSTPPQRSWGKNFFQKDKEAAIEFMDVLGYEKFSMLGWSDGGITALIAAAQNPERLEKLVVWGANAYLTAKDVELSQGMRDVSNWSERMRKPMEEIYGVEGFAKLWGEWCDAYKVIFEENNGEIIENGLKDITAPTLILHGDKDPMVDGVHPICLNEKIKGSRLERFPDGKHNIHMKYKNEFNKMVEDFIINN